jgi:hypothetical protein
MELIVVQINVTLALLLAHCMRFAWNRWAYARRTGRQLASPATGAQQDC